MKRVVSILLIILLILAIFTSILFAEEAKYDFRKTNWGMSKEQVRASEKGERTFEDEGEIDYKVKIGGDKYTCSYLFLKDKLYKAEYYLFSEKHTDQNLYIYTKLRKILIKKYGKPTTDEGVWIKDNSLYKDDETGLTIRLENMVIYSSWKTPTTNIYLKSAGSNYEIQLAVVYESKELKEWAYKIKEEEIESNF